MIAYFKFEIEKLRRQIYGQRSERAARLLDQVELAAAIALPWSNEQTEGQIRKLKLVKRQMYGRGNLHLLQARVIGLA